ncbi:MAG: 30S ribosomal protein S12 methylthiotransferase RimO [Bacteroidales bacterium]|nr:30S ribosomal protein S12 methylthiotransferase RimO [Bacteroidales bacterium]
MPSLQVITLGCSKNTVDTEHLLAQVDGVYDIVPADFDGKVDVLLINTCGFIGDAKEESIQTILEQVQSARAGKVYVFGCLSQRYADSLPGLIPEVDGWFGAREIDPVLKALGVEPDRSKDTVRHFPGSSYAFLKISEGCDRRCSYCAIPYIRGAHRSVPMELLVKEAEGLAAKGVKELVVIAQDTTFYGLDLYGKRCLAALLHKLSQVDGIEWIRLHYSYPAGFPEDVLDEMASNPKICKYMDIPLQHVSDKVLENMHRGVDGQWTRELIRKMRSRVKGIVLRTTMIVGHPGEGKKDFEELLDFVREARFERLGAFTYSEEEGTWGARNLKDSIPSRTKAERLSRLMYLQGGISLEFNRSRIGSTERVLVDSLSSGVYVCRSQWESPEVDGEILLHYDKAMGPDPQALVGQFVNVRITGADEYDLIAEYIN